MTNKTLNQIIKDSGIITERTNNSVYLIYNGKKIIRPRCDNCYSIVLCEFGINLKNYE